MVYFKVAFFVVLDQVSLCDFLAFKRYGFIYDKDGQFILTSFWVDTHLYRATQGSEFNLVEQRYDLVI
jgi:hypothetical protein